MYFSPQISPSSVEHLSDQGIKTILCCRPDDEDPGQPSFEAVQHAAAEAGLRAFYVPVAPGAYGADNVAALKQILAEAETPIIAYCRSGKRAQDFCALAAPA